jgi:hypothetical protein
MMTEGFWISLGMAMVCSVIAVGAIYILFFRKDEI